MSLVVVTSIVSQIERRTTANFAITERARQNALFALNVSLGQLQREAGPDQRVTARAEILDSITSTAQPDGLTQPYWSGVWKTGSAGLDQVSSGDPQRKTSLGAPSPTLRQKSDSAKWLVSNPDPAATVKLSPIDWAAVTTGSGRNAVTLARGLGSSSATVAAPLVSITDDSSATSITTGRYAYWVSDEGVKAKANIKDPTLAMGASANYSANQLHFIAPQSFATGKGLFGTNSADYRASTELTKVATLESLQQLPETPAGTLSGTNASRYAPDATVWSYGVIADVRNGRLKQDLTAAFEDPAPPAQFGKLRGNDSAGNYLVYRASDSNSVVSGSASFGNALPIDGLFWTSLYFYYNLYKTTMPSPVISASGTAPDGIHSQSSWPIGAGSPFSVQMRWYNQTLPSLASPLITDRMVPVVLAYGIDGALASYLDAGLYKLEMRYYPRLILYNPYSVRLTAPVSFTVSLNFDAYRNRNMNVTVGATSTGNFLVNQYTASNNRLPLETKQGQLVTFEPGEIKFFGLDAQPARMGTMEQAITFSQRLVTSGSISPDFYQSAPIPVFTGTANGADLVKVTTDFNSPSIGYADSNYVFNRWPLNSGNRRTILGPPYNAPQAKSWPATGIPISSMNGNPYRIMGVYIRSKGLRAPSASPAYFNQGNMFPLFSGGSPDFNMIDPSGKTQEVLVPNMGPAYSAFTEVQMDANGRTTWGRTSAGVDVPGSGSRVVLRDVPVQPMVSLGQFMHLPTYNFVTAGQFMAFPFTFVGSSWASPNVPLNATCDTANPNERLMIDHSFRANETLFDGFFFSTVPSALNGAPGSSVYSAPYNTLNAATIKSDQPLPNNRMKFYRKGGAEPALADLRDVDKAAANLLLDGAFNVNSTSVSAWRALLSSLSGNDLRLFNANGGALATLSDSTLKNPIPRFLSGGNSASVNQPWDGVRALSDDEVTELASRIVTEVKTRGPFLSMGDFLNRRLGSSSSDLTLKGALQAAIDNTSPDINSAAKSTGTGVNFDYTVITPAPIPIVARAPGNTAVGMPGYLGQADLVQAFSPVMTVRSDTFVIRCYGETNNKATAAPEGRAWGEAVVQRVPDFMDASQLPETLLSVLNSTNAAFGRRFKVVSFRWLNESDL